VGRVLLPDGSPAAGARVIHIPADDGQGASWNDATTVTTDGGAFSLGLPSYVPGDGRLYVRDATGRYAAVVAATALVRGTPIEIKLVEGARAGGRVLDEQGKPVVGWTVVYNRVGSHWGGGGGGGPAYPRPRFAAAFTDGEGRYELTGLLPVGRAEEVEIALLPDLLITGSSMLPGRESPERRSHLGPQIAPGQMRDGFDFEVSMGRRGEYRIVPKIRSAQ
jgi:hypothetical protein